SWNVGRIWILSKQDSDAMSFRNLLLGRTHEIEADATGFWSFREAERAALGRHGISVRTFGPPPADIVFDFLEEAWPALKKKLDAASFHPDIAIILTCGY